MTSNLRERANAAATTPGTAPARPDEPEHEQLPAVEAPEGQDDDPPVVPVQVAVARLMRDLGKIYKADKFDGGNAGRYNFRGIDRVVNAVAPMQRKHGVLIVPELRTAEYRDIARAGGGRSHECVVTMAYHFTGPAGDPPITCVVGGEALDTSDKATAKAQSVAWRVCLIQMLAIPTGDPDPDSVRIERGEQPMPKAKDYRDEIVDPATSLARLRQIRVELRQHNLGGALAVNEVGDDEALLAMCERIGLQRKGER